MEKKIFREMAAEAWCLLVNVINSECYDASARSIWIAFRKKLAEFLHGSLGEYSALIAVNGLSALVAVSTETKKGATEYCSRQDFLVDKSTPIKKTVASYYVCRGGIFMGIFRRIHNRIVRLAIQVTRRRPAPNTIPLSPPRAYANNFYQTELYEHHDSNKYMLVDALTERGVEGIYFNSIGESGLRASIPNENLGLFRLEIRYYLHGYELRTKTAAMFLLHWVTWYPQVAIWRDKTAQFLFNRRRLVRQDRIELLRMFAAKTIKNPAYTASATNLLHELHSFRGFGHPQGNEALNYYRLMLDSFVTSGDLELTQHAYRLHARGFAGLAEFELEERRFKEGLRQQRLVGWLTIALVAVGIAQAYVTYISK